MRRGRGQGDAELSGIFEHAYAIERLASLERLDPLRYFRFQCDGQRDLARHVYAGLEVHAFTGNEGGKTTTVLAAFVAMAQGRPELDGLPVPKLALPATFWLIVKSRRGAVDSSQAKLLELSGADPSRDVGWAARGLSYAETVRIRPYGAHSEDRDSWSKFVIHSEEGGESLPGGRIDGAIGDEPPDRRNWREVRSRAKSNRPLYLAIAETPVRKSQWWWLFHEDDGFRNCLNQPRGGRVSVNWHVRDVRCHSAAHLRDLEARRVGDPLAEARMSGWPVDDEGTSPFDGRTLALIRAECVTPEVVQVPLWQTSEDEHDRESLAESATYERLCPWQPWGRYTLTVDPSAGTSDGKPDPARDPSGFHVCEETDPALVARYSGYLDPYSVGWLAGTVALEAAKVCGAVPKIEVEMQDGWGLETIRALRRMRYPNIGFRTEVNDPTGRRATKYGFAMTDSIRRACFAAIHAWLTGVRAGRAEFKLWSAAVVDCLADIVTDEDGRPVKAPGRHIEDAILLGHFLHRLGLPRPWSQVQQRATDRTGAMLRAEFGHDPRRPRSSDGAPEAFGLGGR